MTSKVHQTITDIMIARIEARRAEGAYALPWRRTWNAEMGAPRNLVSDKPYRGSNVFMTMMSGFSNPYWVTARQCRELGGTIKPGESYTPITFWQFPTEEERKADKRKGVLIRFYQAWNVQQTSGLEAYTLEKLEPYVNRPRPEPIAECERLLRYAGRPDVIHGGERACYHPSSDVIAMPTPESFTSMAEYYVTRFHEETHATGHRTRLNRDAVVNPITFGSHAYSTEELVAEMGASMLASHAGISTAGILDNSAAYLDGWLRRLKAEPTMLISAGSAAQKAMDHILGVTFTCEKNAA